MRLRFSLAALVAVAALSLQSAGMAAEPLKVLFLGDEGHHRPAERFAQVQGLLADRGVEMVYTDDLGDLSAEKLAGYDALAVFANIDSLPGDAEAAMLAYVRGGGGLVPLHCATSAFATLQFGLTWWEPSLSGMAPVSFARRSWPLTTR